MNEDELAKQIKQYKDLHSANKEIDVASLAMAALSGANDQMLTSKEKRWGYMVSLAVPPFGLLYAVKFFTSGKSDGKTAAYVCLGLTVASIALLLLTTNLMFSSTGLTVDQLKQAPGQYQELVQ
ncbi:MAG: hypothetical protein KW788_00600 [Candidatus Doudnabacteria bacterium]|nr:hypothetical protein [Candidatus Doudnabacteria bacterium]